LMVICPLAAPAEAGWNWICSAIDCDGFSVTGRPLPTIVKPAPVIVAELIVTGAVPAEISVSDCVVAVFTVTLPKFRLDELTVSCWLVCGPDEVVPVPVKATTAVLPLVELLLIVTCPLAVPAVVGRNWTCSVIACDGFSVAGNPLPTIVKPVPVIVAELIVTGAVPHDVNVSVCVVAVLTVELPKFKLVALTVNCADVWGVPVVLAAETLDPDPQPDTRSVTQHARASRRVVAPNRRRCRLRLEDSPAKESADANETGPENQTSGRIPDTNIHLFKSCQRARIRGRKKIR
jgi:hypothetical protein